MTAPAAVRLRRRLADELASTGKLHDPRWRSAVESVPREVLLGPAVYRQVPNEPGPVWTPSARRDLGDEAWLRLAYTDETWVTQVEGLLAEDAADGRRVTGSATSSSSLPGLVVQMLE